MTIQRMDNVGIVVEDLDAAIAFFTELGMEREGKAQIEGLWADRTVGLDGVRSDIAMMRTPDGHSKLELTKYHTPAAIGARPHNPPPNTLGLHRVMFAAELSGADLSHAYLKDATVKEEQLEQAESLEGATMPNGQTYEEWLKGKGSREDGENSGPS